MFGMQSGKALWFQFRNAHISIIPVFDLASVIGTVIISCSLGCISCQWRTSRWDCCTMPTGMWQLLSLIFF